MTARSGSVGGMLRSARERRGLSVLQVAAATKISKALIEALERDDVSRLPGGISGRAFVRAYASEVGLDPDRTLEALVAQSADAPAARRHVSPSDVEDHQAVDNERRAASVFLQLVLVSAPLAGLILYAGRTAEQSAQTLAAPFHVAEPAPVGVQSTPDGKPRMLVIQLASVRACQVVAIVDGTERVRREFGRGEQEMLEVTREVLLTVSDAGAVTMTLNGAPAKPFGTAGYQATIRLTPETFGHFVVTR